MGPNLINYVTNQFLVTSWPNRYYDYHRLPHINKLINNYKENYYVCINSKQTLYVTKYGHRKLSSTHSNPKNIRGSKHRAGSGRYESCRKIWMGQNFKAGSRSYLASKIMVVHTSSEKKFAV